MLRQANRELAVLKWDRELMSDLAYGRNAQTSKLFLRRNLKRFVRIGIEAQPLGEGNDRRLDRSARDMNPVA
jgi:hypothetical protein